MPVQRDTGPRRRRPASGSAAVRHAAPEVRWTPVDQLSELARALLSDDLGGREAVPRHVAERVRAEAGAWAGHGFTAETVRPWLDLPPAAAAYLVERAVDPRGARAAGPGGPARCSRRPPAGHRVRAARRGTGVRPAGGDRGTPASRRGGAGIRRSGAVDTARGDLRVDRRGGSPPWSPPSRAARSRRWSSRTRPRSDRRTGAAAERLRAGMPQKGRAVMPRNGPGSSSGRVPRWAAPGTSCRVRRGVAGWQRVPHTRGPIGPAPAAPGGADRGRHPSGRRAPAAPRRLEGPDRRLHRLRRARLGPGDGSGRPRPAGAQSPPPGREGTRLAQLHHPAGEARPGA